MRKIASATLVREHPRDRQCTVDLVELDLPDGARCIVTVRQGLSESSLTAVPTSRDEAERRALDFLRRRLAAGDRLVRRDGFEALDVPVAAQPATTPVPPVPQAVPPAIVALAARFHPAPWKLESPERRARAAWRVAECSVGDDTPAQRTLRALVPRLVDLLGSGDDLLDLCLAAAIGRLGDPGAAEAMRELSQRGRSPATQRYAHQAWLMLQSPETLQAHAARLAGEWQDTLDLADNGGDLADRLGETLDTNRRTWAHVLPAWYDIALARPDVRARLLDVLRALPLEPGTFPGVRYVYKAAVLRRDAEVVGVLHARFENTGPGPRPTSQRRSSAAL